MGKYVTQEHKEELKNELRELQRQLTGRVADKLSSVTTKDQAEDATYAEAIQERDMLRERIEKLEKMLTELKVIDPINEQTEYVTLGSWVTVEMNGDKRKLRVVGVTEANPTDSKISYESPLGQALVGAKIGEKVIVIGPDGKEQQACVISLEVN